MSAAGVEYTAGWYFNFPSSDEAILWRVCSAVLTGIAFLLPLVHFLFNIRTHNRRNPFAIAGKRVNHFKQYNKNKTILSENEIRVDGLLKTSVHEEKTE